MLANPLAEFAYRENNLTAPSLTLGSTCTPGNNTKSAYTDTGIVCDDDVFGIWIMLFNVGTSASGEDTLVDIGVDPAGGTSFGVVIPDLLASSCGGNLSGNAAAPIEYFFPLFIKGGSKIGFRAAQNDATPVAVRAIITVFGKPMRPEFAKAGTYVDAFGIVSASSRGTLITPGLSAAEGTHAQLGATTTKDYWWWQVGFGLNDATMSNAAYLLDVAVGSATEKKTVIQDELFIVTSGESIGKYFTSGKYSGIAPSGQNVYGRASTQLAVNDTEPSMAAYALGG